MMGIDQEECMKKLKNESVVLDMESLSSHIYDGKSVHTSIKGMERSMSRKASNWFERTTCEGRDSDKESITSNESRVLGLRRYMSWDRRSSPWLGPRRVLLFFATLSSMGTILLIYFTLSTTNMNGVDDTTIQS